MTSTIILPTAPTPPTRVNPRILVLYGPPKVGKTTILAKLPGCLIMDFDPEGGTDLLEALKIRISSRQQLEQVCSAIREQKAKTGEWPYKYIAMDTVTDIEEWCEQLATETYKNSVIGKTFTGKSVLELPKGGGYLYLRQAFQEITQLVGSVCPNIILVGHLRDKFLEKDTIEASAKDLDLTGKIRTIVCSRADAVGYMYRKKNGPLMVSFQTTEEVNCGSRCGHLAGKLMEFDWSKIYI